ncbi:MAG: bifunctional methionine sulfoxide reductase B/A protein [Planctomycetota bacterium]|jgi:peptide methionine sulfoxide reductase msrA/msrB
MKLREYLIVSRWLPFTVLFVAVAIGGALVEPYQAKNPIKTTLIDDFSRDDPKNSSGTDWEFFSDRVMGGVSSGKMVFVNEDERSSMHMTGAVSLANNGGFIQARKNFNPRGRSFDARRFAGIKLNVKGNGQSYAIHLRTSQTRLPWQYYQGAFSTNEQWREIKIPFTLFKPNSLGRPLDTRTLKSIGIVAIGREFQADIFVDEISFYGDKTMYKKLTAEEQRIILRKGTERPFTGKYDKHFEDGIYTCRQCGEELFDSSSKFKSSCGWPSYDDQKGQAVTKQPDADGVRTEIICTNCGGHLGHVFTGEEYTPKNTRYCVNSVSIDFTPAQKSPAQEAKTERAILASGCFWGTEYHLQKVPGVISTTVGYTGGHVENPTYKQVCTDKTGHAEAVEVVYDPSKTSYEKLARLYFETHDFTQLNRQGPDIGTQYRSEIFYLDEKQRNTAGKLIDTLKKKGFDVKTEVTKADKFWPAENYHQDYYQNNGKTPYCHIYRKIF